MKKIKPNCFVTPRKSIYDLKHYPLTMNKNYKVLDICNWDSTIEILNDRNIRHWYYMNTFKLSNNFKDKIKFVKELL